MDSIDFSEPKVLVLFIGMFLAISLVSIIIFIGFRVFKLYIPRSKLYDDEYIKQSIYNTKIFRRGSLAIFIIQAIIAGLCHVKIINYEPKDNMSLFGVYIILMLLFFLIGLGPLLVGRRSGLRQMKEYLNGTDIVPVIRDKRIIADRKKNR